MDLLPGMIKALEYSSDSSISSPDPPAGPLWLGVVSWVPIMGGSAGLYTPDIPPIDQVRPACFQITMLTTAVYCNYLTPPISHVNPWFHTMLVVWNLGLTWELPTITSLAKLSSWLGFNPWSIAGDDTRCIFPCSFLILLTLNVISLWMWIFIPQWIGYTSLPLFVSPI